MKLKLTDRMQAIADHVKPGQRLADIGTDHGYIPVWLSSTGTSPHVIMADINPGPLKRAEENYCKYIKDGSKPDLRLGSGLTVLEPGEADAAVIAGMGGILIADILRESPEVTESLETLILQPRTNSDVLRRYLYEELRGFTVTYELVIKEGPKYSEIIVLERSETLNRKTQSACPDSKVSSACPDPFYYRIPRLYLAQMTPVVREYLEKLLDSRRRIAENIRNSARSDQSIDSLDESLEFINKLEEFLKQVPKDTGAVDKHITA